MTDFLTLAQCSRRALFALCATAVIALSGCSAGQTMRVRDLPPHFVARPFENAQTVDLSRLAADTTGNDVLGPGDVVEVAIAAGLGSDEATEISTRVTEDGTAELPQIGRVFVAGLELQDAEQAIVTQSIQAGIYRKPHVTVTMKQPKLIRVTVAGAVNEPGTYELRPGAGNLLNALVSAGSLADDAGVNVEIRQPGVATPNAKSKAPLVAGRRVNRNGVQLAGHNVAAGPSVPAQTVSSPQTLKVNLASVQKNSGNKYRLRDGAVVFVEQRDPMPVSIGGLVDKPGRYDYPVGENLRLLDAIDLAGGESNLVADKIFVIREAEANGQRQRGVIQVSLNKAKHDDAENLLIQPGDVISVEKTPGTVFLETLRTVGFNLSGRAF